MRFTLKNLRFLQYIDYQNVRKTEFLGCQSQDVICGHLIPAGTGQKEFQDIVVSSKEDYLKEMNDL